MLLPDDPEPDSEVPLELGDIPDPLVEEPLVVPEPLALPPDVLPPVLALPDEPPVELEPADEPPLELALPPAAPALPPELPPEAPALPPPDAPPPDPPPEPPPPPPDWASASVEEIAKTEANAIVVIFIWSSSCCRKGMTSEMLRSPPSALQTKSPSSTSPETTG